MSSPQPSLFSKSTERCTTKSTPTNTESTSLLEPSHSSVAVMEVNTPDTASLERSSGALRSITMQLHEIELELIESGGVLTPYLEGRLSSATLAKEKKIDAYVAIWKRAESIAIEYGERADKLTAVKKAATTLVKTLKDNLKEASKILGIVELEGENNRIKISDSAPELQIIDMNLVPPQYTREVTTLEVDKEALSKALARGEKVPGIHWEPKKRINIYPVKGKLK